jgi:hypothetical protein
MNYSHEAEGLRVVSTEKSSFKIILDRSQGLWYVETESGPLPVCLRDKRYTSHQYAYKDIKNYLDGHAERSVVYSNKKKPTAKE